MTTTRLEVRLDANLKAKAEKASALLGAKSLSAYVVGLMDESATKVIAQHEGITIKDNIFDRFINACAEARKPNQTLANAAELAKKQEIK